nr:ribonuclease HII [Leptospira kobayashii]
MDLSFDKAPKRPYFPELSLPKHLPILSIDEAGRGTLAGPVAIGMVSFDIETIEKIQSGEVLKGIRDSKLLSLEKRRFFAEEVKKLAKVWRVVFVSHKFIDRYNINQAIFYGINRSIPKNLIPHPFLFVDGNYKIKISKPIEGYFSLPKGDDLMPSISAASVLAKTYRDDWMEKMETVFPGYGFAKHKGYGTEFHRNQVKKLGISRIHRLSFLKFLREEVVKEELFPNDPLA